MLSGPWRMSTDSGQSAFQMFGGKQSQAWCMQLHGLSLPLRNTKTENGHGPGCQRGDRNQDPRGT